MEFVAATNNAGKMSEIKRILEAMGHSVVSQKEAGITAEPEENADTFEGNALIKAKEIALLVKKPVIADDSGLCVDALNGAPGVFSARYSGKHGDDTANNEKLLSEMKSIKDNSRAAQFVSCVCIYFPKCGDFTLEKQDMNNSKSTKCENSGETNEAETYMLFKGECPGTIALEGKGTNGFGYDPIFIPDYVGLEKNSEKKELNTKKRTYAELKADEKDAISHRGCAMRKMQEKLKELNF